jgi:two-component system phosphate regulon sensor histidine kinase PhoR
MGEGDDRYAHVLREFIHTGGEAALYQASLLSRAFVEQGVGPEEIVALHVEALATATADLSYREQARAATDGLQFLLEVMITYGVQHKQYLELRLQELARSEASKAEVIAAIAHELRTPLTAAKGTLDLAVRSLDRGHVERVGPLLGTSRQAMERLARLTADLIEASRDEPRRVERSQIALEGVLAQACAWASASAAEKGVVVVYETAMDASSVHGNHDALLSVFGNLLSNAVRYTPSGGRVTVRHGTRGTWAWSEVRDTGIGMAPEVRDRIFDKFFRAAEARTIEASGLGLGLALVKQIVDAHQGWIEVESEPGQGSTFRVFLPTFADEQEERCERE